MEISAALWAVRLGKNFTVSLPPPNTAEVQLTSAKSSSRKTP